LTLIVYHRGGGKSLGLPPNCLRTIQWALERRARAIEYDTCVCRDGDRHRMVVIEPALLAATSLDIDGLDWADLQGINAGNARYGRCPVATLAEVLRTVAGRAHQQIHLKGSHPLTVPTLVEEVGEDADCLITSFSLAVLEQVKALRPGLRVGWLVRPDTEIGSEGSRDLTAQVSRSRLPLYNGSEIAELLIRARIKGVDCLLLCAPRFAGTLYDFCPEGLEIGCWGVGSDLDLAMRLIAAGVDRFTIDNPEELPLSAGG
jgi:glycerophosphoryl diester phosphodiesterase